MPVSKKTLLTSGSILGMALALGTGSMASVPSNPDGMSTVPQAAKDRLLFLGYSNPHDAISSEFQTAQNTMEMLDMKTMEMLDMKTMEMMEMVVK